MEEKACRMAFRRLMKKPSYPNTDCPNFIKYRSLNTYRWYARVVSPICGVG